MVYTFNLFPFQYGNLFEQKHIFILSFYKTLVTILFKKIETSAHYI